MIGATIDRSVVLHVKLNSVSDCLVHVNEFACQGAEQSLVLNVNPNHVCSGESNFVDSHFLDFHVLGFRIAADFCF